MALERSVSVAERRLSVPEDRCEVDNRQDLRAYRKMWKMWMKWYEVESGSYHSIEKQIKTALLHDMTYRSLASAFAEVSGAPSSSALAFVLNSGHVTTQVMLLRKLLDQRNDVLSLTRLVKDVAKNQGLITRKNYVSAFGLPYDPQITLGERDLEGDNDCPHVLGEKIARAERSRELHGAFDKLSGKQPHERSREDLIDSQVFKSLEHKLKSDAAQKVKRVRDKFIAHAASDDVILVEKGFHVTYGDLEQVLSTIVQVEHLLIYYILAYGVKSEVVPHLPLGYFDERDQPQASSALSKRAQDRFHELREIRERWGNQPLEALLI